MTCLVATGTDQSILIVMLLGVAAVLFAAGIVAVRSAKARAALIVIPVLLLAGAAIVPAAPAQAVTAKIADTVMSTEWHYDDYPDIDSDVPTAANFELFQQAAALQQAAGTIPVYQTFITWPGDNVNDPETFEANPNIAGLDASNAVAELDAGDVQDAIDDWWFPLQDETAVYGLTVTITFNYVDDCGKPLQTVFTYSGEFNNQIAD